MQGGTADEWGTRSGVAPPFFNLFIVRLADIAFLVEKKQS